MGLRIKDLPLHAQELVKQQIGAAAAKRRGKFNVAAVPDRTYNGIVYASKAEMIRAQDLDGQVQAGLIRGYCRQVPFTLGVPENRYVADFLVFLNNNMVQVQEVKGVWTAKWKRDVNLWRRYGLCELVVFTREGGKWSFESIVPVGAPS